MFRYSIEWHNDNPSTIWNKLAVKLGREPFCKTIVDENRDPTPDEEAAAHAFALAQHNAIQGT